jgi:multiple sugar transport system substrate-binding protein
MTPARPHPALVSRRTLLAGLAAGATVPWLAGCGGFSTGGGPERSADDRLTMVLWGADAEVAAFQALADGFRESEGVTVELQVVPFDQALTTVDTGLRTDSPPDLFRVTYNDVGTYRTQGVLATLDGADDLADGFLPAFWAAVSDDDGTFGIPHHTDTSMVLVNTDALAAAGATLPTSLDEAWTWEEFVQVATRLRDAVPGTTPFAVNWQQAGAYRWLNWVDQAGGRLLTDDLTGSAVASDDGALRALGLTRSFFTEGLTPRTATTKGSFASELWTTGTTAMAFVGDFLLPGLREATAFPWDGTYLPRDERASADLGGNALVAVDGDRSEQAAAFLRWCAQPEQVAAFCEATTVLPTRTDVAPADLEYAVEPELMRRYVEQATTIREELVAQVTVPTFGRVNAALLERLETAFLGDAPDEEVLAGLEADVEAAVSGR